MNLRSRLVALAGWLLVAVFAVAVSRCVRIHSAEPSRKPLGEADLQQSWARTPVVCIDRYGLVITPNGSLLVDVDHPRGFAVDTAAMMPTLSRYQP